MTREEFFDSYYLKYEENKNDNTLTIKTLVFDKNENLIDSILTNINIYETNNWIKDTQSLISITPYDWKSVIEKTLRFQLDFLAQRVPITNFYPNNSNENISNFYKM